MASRIICGLSWSRYSYGNHVKWSSCNGCCFTINRLELHTIITSSKNSIIAGNESCPQPQTSEHLAAIEIMKLKHIIILQNKIDLIRDTQAKDQYQEILKFVQGTNSVLLLK